MLGSAAFFSLLLLAHYSRAQYVPPQALVEPLKPVGIRISIPDEPGISLVAFHVKFNEDFVGLEAGTIARDIVRSKNERWTYEDRSTKLKQGDVIYYWIHVVYNGLGYNLLDQKLRVTEFFDYSGKKIEDRFNDNDNDNDHQPCISSSTKVFDSSGSSRYPCAGQLLFEENFRDLDQFRRSKWTIVEQFSSKPDVLKTLITDMYVLNIFLKPFFFTLFTLKTFCAVRVPRSHTISSKRNAKKKIINQLQRTDYEFVLYGDAEENLKIDNKLKITPKLVTDDDIIRRGSVTVENCTGRKGTTDCVRDARGYNIIPPVNSARINTKRAINFEYGRVEVKAKFPKGDWVYPLLMLEPIKNSDSSAGTSLQIRIASSAGNTYLRADNDRDISGHILWGGPINSNEKNIYEDRINQYRSVKYSRDLWSEDFHVYELSWSKAKMILKVDGLRYDEIRNLDIPEDTPFYLTLGVAAGGIAEFPDNSVGNGYNKTWVNTDPKALLNFYNTKDKWYRTWDDSTALIVEFVKIWAL